MPTKLPSHYKLTSHLRLPIGRECVGQPSEYSGMCDGNSSQQSLLALCISWAWLIRVCPGGSELLLVCWQNLVLEIARLSHRLDHSIFTEVTNSAPMRAGSWEGRNSSGKQNRHCLVNNYSRCCHLILRYRFIKSWVLSLMVWIWFTFVPFTIAST